jgi:3-hydroxyisobutyrate dehydrogenase-like beta-hydroxyacid dehydrogenase
VPLAATAVAAATLAEATAAGFGREDFSALGKVILSRP